MNLKKLNDEIKSASYHSRKSPQNKKIQKLTIPEQRKQKDLMKNENKAKYLQIIIAALFRKAIFEDPSIKNKDKKINGIYYCGSYRNYLLDKNKSHKRLKRAIFCNERLCPNCGRRKAYKARIKLQTIFNYLNHHYQYKNGNPKYLPIFATFTVPNAKDNQHDIKYTYKRLHHKFALMMSFKRFCGFFSRGKQHLSGVVQGGVSKVEITYNKKHDSFHLHLHTLLLVHRSYFSGRYYIPFKEWRANWEKAWGWNPQKEGKHLEINIERPWYRDKKTGKKCRVINAKDVMEADTHAITEATGYGTKADDFFRMLDPHNTKKANVLNFKRCQKAFISVYFGTKNQKTYTNFGLIKKLSKMYNAGELDDYKPTDNHTYEYDMNAKWNDQKKKFILKVTKMTKEEMKEAEAKGIKTPLSDKSNKSNKEAKKTISKEFITIHILIKELIKAKKANPTRFQIESKSLMNDPNISNIIKGQIMLIC